MKNKNDIAERISALVARMQNRGNDNPGAMTKSEYDTLCSIATDAENTPRVNAYERDQEVIHDLLDALKEVYRPGQPRHDSACIAVRGVPHSCNCKSGRAWDAIAKAEGR